jgi:hypothetical protein
MTDKVTLNHVSSFVNDSSAVGVVNANMDAITHAIDNTLSLDGTLPNDMLANLDMNSHENINLGPPTTPTSAVRLEDVVTNPSVVVPPTGTSGHTVPFLDGNNTWSGTQNYAGNLTAAVGANIELNPAAYVHVPTMITSDNSINAASTAFVKANITGASMAGLSVLGRAGASSGTGAAIVATAANQFLGLDSSGTALAFRTMTGDATISDGTLTLTTINSNTGAFGSASSVPTITLDGKGRATSASSTAVVAPAGTLSGTTLNSTVVNSTLGNTANGLALGVDSATPTSSNVHAQNVATGTSNTPGVDLIVGGGKSTGTGVGGKVKIQTTPVGSSGSTQNTLTDRITADGPGNVVIGSAAIATNATDGFLYIPTCAGPATGTPTAYGGRAPMVFDSTNNKLYIYNPATFAWKSTVALT